MCWRIYFLDRVTGLFEVLTVFSPIEAWDAFLSESRLSRIVDAGRYKSWLEGITFSPSLEHIKHLTSL